MFTSNNPSINQSIRKLVRCLSTQLKKQVPWMAMWSIPLVQIDGVVADILKWMWKICQESEIFLAACHHGLIWIFCDMIHGNEL